MNERRTVLVDTLWLQHGFAENDTTPTIAPEIPFLEKIADMTKQGRLGLYISELISWETYGAPGVSQWGRSNHLFHRNMITKIRSGFGLDLVFAAPGLRMLQYDYRGQLRRVLEHHKDQDLEWLISRVGRTHRVDAAHLITACRHRLDFFLCDPSFSVSFNSNISSRDRPRFSQPITPSVLVTRIEELGLASLSNLPENRQAR